jgi:hypothetical protein
VQQLERCCLLVARPALQCSVLPQQLLAQAQRINFLQVVDLLVLQ